MASSITVNFFILYLAFVCLSLAIYVWLRKMKQSMLLEQKKLATQNQLNQQ